MAYTNFYGFIDPDYIRNNSTICGELEDTFITPYITTSQEKWVLPILGSSLYNDLLSEIEEYITSSATISTVYVSLINNYIKNLHLHYALYEMLPFVSYKIGNISVAKKSSEHSQPVDQTEFVYLRNSIKSTAQYYAQRLEEHLCAHSTLYPKYNEAIGNTDGISPQKEDTNCGIFLDF